MALIGYSTRWEQEYARSIEECVEANARADARGRGPHFYRLTEEENFLADAPRPLYFLRPNKYTHRPRTPK